MKFKDFAEKIELKRTVWHIIGMYLIVIVGSWIKTNIPWFFPIALDMFLAGELIFEYFFKFLLRDRIPLKWILRQEERDGITMTLPTALATVLVFRYVPFEIGKVAFLFLALGDPAAKTWGKLKGKTPIRINPTKTWEGTRAFFIVSLIVAAFTIENPFVVIFGAALAAFAETLPRRHGIFDDNLLIPLISAYGMWGLSLLLGLI